MRGMDLFPAERGKLLAIAQDRRSPVADKIGTPRPHPQTFSKLVFLINMVYGDLGIIKDGRTSQDHATGASQTPLNVAPVGDAQQADDPTKGPFSDKVVEKVICSNVI